MKLSLNSKVSAVELMEMPRCFSRSIQSDVADLDALRGGWPEPHICTVCDGINPDVLAKFTKSIIVHPCVVLALPAGLDLPSLVDSTSEQQQLLCHCGLRA